MTEQQLPEGWQMVKFGDIAKHISMSGWNIWIQTA